MPEFNFDKEITQEVKMVILKQYSVVDPFEVEVNDFPPDDQIIYKRWTNYAGIEELIIRISVSDVTSTKQTIIYDVAFDVWEDRVSADYV